MDERQAGMEPTLAVFSQPPVLLQPGKAALHHPTLWHDLEGVQPTTFGDLHCDVLPQCVTHTLGNGLAHIATVAQHALPLCEAGFTARQRLQRPRAIGDLRGSHRHRVRQPLRVHRDVALYSRNLLARVIALQARSVGVHHAVRVDDQERAAGVAPPFSRGPCQLDFFKACSSRLPPSRGSLQIAKYECTVRHLGKCVGQHAPLAAAPEQVPHCTEHLVQVYPPRTGFSACAFQQRLDGFEWFSTDVAGVALSHLPRFS